MVRFEKNQTSPTYILRSKMFKQFSTPFFLINFDENRPVEKTDESIEHSTLNLIIRKVEISLIEITHMNIQE